MQQERALYADAVGGDPTHGEVGACSAPMYAGDDTLENLHSLALTLDNARVHLDRVTWVQLGYIQIGFQLTFQ
jgi:hypothetical protein